MYIKDIKKTFVFRICVETKFTIYENLKVYLLNKVFTQMDSIHIKILNVNAKSTLN